MARIRSIKPEFWLDRKLARQTSRDARLLYIGLWNQADEWGRLHGDPAVIKGQIFPYEDLDVDPLLKELTEVGAIVAYEYDEDPFLFLPKLARHQRLEPGKVASRLPEPPSGADECARGADKSAPDPDSIIETGPCADHPASPQADSMIPYGADLSARDADSSETICALHVAGSREHVAGDRGSGGKGTRPPRAGRKRPATPIPDEFPLVGARAQYAHDHRMTRPIAERETARFIDWARSKDERKVDWDAAWRNWVRTWEERQHPAVNGASPKRSVVD